MRCGMVWALVIAFGACGCSAASGAESDPQTAEWFEEQIRPILAKHCVQCHGEKKQESNLRLDTLEALLAGGDSGPAIVRNQPQESLLIEALKYESFEMPPSGPLDEQAIARFEDWITHGAVWPKTDVAIRPSSREISLEERGWWAFQPLADPDIPTVADDHWSHNALDRFVMHRLAQRRMRPAPQADEATLVRRLFFDLIGLPPTPEQMDQYFADDPTGRWEALVDSLLADPAYGEHWGRHWLDVVRYAESDGWNQDAYRPYIWRYRDYVVRSFNEDRPYPQFVRQQLAGDEMPNDDPDNLAATGFLRLGIYEYNQRDARSHWNDIVNEMTDVAGDVFFGLGISCARCHDHKFDPLLQRDYYRLRAFFEPVIWRDDVSAATPQQLADYTQQLAQWQAATAGVQTQIDALLKPYYDRKWESTVDKFPLDIQTCFRKPPGERTSWEQQMAYLVSRQFQEEGGGPLAKLSKEDRQKYEALKQQLVEFEVPKPKPLPHLMTASDFAGPASPTVIPGDPNQQPVPPGFPVVLCSVVPDPPMDPHRVEHFGPRTRLARWIADPENPLTTRVIVNRIWQQHFGRGLVVTANDFGRLGQPPTYPLLLDWLARDFVRKDWSFKRLHKLIVMSATWQQSATHPLADQYQKQDPTGSYLWRATVRRLSAEQMRDAMLAVTGELDRQLGGASVDSQAFRRSLYLKSFRNRPNELLQTFDMANGLKSVPQRDSTTTPVQALLMMNGAFSLGRATTLTNRLLERGGHRDALLTYAFRLAWGRGPTAGELADANSFIGGDDGQDLAEINCTRLTDFCHVLLNSNAFAYVD